MREEMKNNQLTEPLIKMTQLHRRKKRKEMSILRMHGLKQIEVIIC